MMRDDRPRKVPSPKEFIDILKSIVKENERERKLGVVSSTYVSGRPKVLIDGEMTDSVKAYPYLASYTPAANDKVALVKFGSTWVVIGKVV